jgi:hypothetical protein
MSAEFRKLAELLRQVADEYEQKKLVKCAQIVRGARGLKLLARKIGRNS